MNGWVIRDVSAVPNIRVIKINRAKIGIKNLRFFKIVCLPTKTKNITSATISAIAPERELVNICAVKKNNGCCGKE